MLDFFYHDDACHVKPQHWDKNNDVIKPWLTYNIIATYAHLEKLRHRNQSHLAITMEPIAYPNKQYLFLSLYLCIYIYIRRVYIYVYISYALYTHDYLFSTASTVYTVYTYSPLQPPQRPWKLLRAGSRRPLPSTVERSCGSPAGPTGRQRWNWWWN